MKKCCFLFGLFFAIQSGSIAQSYTSLVKTVIPDRDYGDLWGWSSGIDGNYAVVGSYEEDYDENNGNFLSRAGAILIYKKDSTGFWALSQKLVAPDRAIEDRLGFSVSISGDYIIAGAPREDHDPLGLNTVSNAGSAYIFKKNPSGTWNFHQKIVASDRGIDDFFGYDVCISGDKVIVGSPSESEDVMGNNTLNNSGSAYIFEKNSLDQWNLVQKITANIRAVDDYFSQWGVAIKENYAIVGSIYDDEDVQEGNYMESAGAAYVFERDSSGTWSQVQKLVASDRFEYNFFAKSVAIDGNCAMVGAIGNSVNEFGTDTMMAAGAVYVFERNSSGIWTQTQKLLDSHRDVGDEFGFALSLAGNRAIVGVRNEAWDIFGNDSLNAAGAAYLFEKNPSGTWALVQKIVQFDRYAGDAFGHSVCIDSNGQIIVGAYFQSYDTSGVNNYVAFAGAAYLFQYCGSTLNVSQTSCSAFSWNNNTYYTSGIYSDTLTNISGCDSIIHLYLTILSPDTTVILSGHTLTATAAADSFQWVDCDNNYFPLNNETNQSFIAQVNGNYAVIMYNGPCVDTSACTPISHLDIPKNESIVSIYPNPFRQFLNISAIGRVDIMDISGKIILTDHLTGSPQKTDLGGFADGIYFIRIISPSGVKTTKVIKQE